MPVCPHCGEGFPPGKLACPHCGSDAETGWKAEDPSDQVYLPEEMTDDEYAHFLADEGLGPRPSSKRPDGRPSTLAMILALIAAFLLWWLWAF